MRGRFAFQVYVLRGNGGFVCGWVFLAIDSDVCGNGPSINYVNFKGGGGSSIFLQPLANGEEPPPLLGGKIHIKICEKYFFT